MNAIFAECCETGRSGRYDTDVPFVVNGVRYATNGAICVSGPAFGEPPTRTVNPPIAGMFEDWPELGAGAGIPLPELVERPGAECAEAVWIGEGAFAISEKYVRLLREHGVTEVYVDPDNPLQARFEFADRQRGGKIRGVVCGCGGVPEHHDAEWFNRTFAPKARGSGPN